MEAERLLAHVLGVTRSQLLTEGDSRLSAAEAGRLARVVRRRTGGEPLQHIEGSVAFRDLVLVADERALIPRPETEQLVDRVLNWIGDRAPLEAALDVGTGSGAIGLSLLSEGGVRRCLGVDTSPAALRQAAENRERVGVDPDRFELRLVERPFWTCLAPGERFDVVVSNPPYVADHELASLSPEVRDREPAGALAGGPDGLDVVREVVEGAAGRLREDGALFLEVGEGQAPSVRRLLESRGWNEVSVTRDLSGRDRFVRARRT